MVSINFEGAKQFYARQPDAAAAQAAFDTLVNGTGAGNDFIGWVDLPVNYDKDEFARIQKAAAKIQADSKALVVIGIGGSYLGARAVVELLKSPNYNALPKSTPDIYFAGNGISSDAVTEILTMIGDRDFSVNVISKSGTTTEPAIAFRIFKAALEKKYGAEGAKGRIYATTDKARGALKTLADRPLLRADGCGPAAHRLLRHRHRGAHARRAGRARGYAPFRRKQRRGAVRHEPPGPVRGRQEY